MENNLQPASENPDQRGLLSSPDEQVPSPAAKSQAQTRLYECNFCKKGFSNAQALGGHMNIHRKDKAKIKQASRETQRSMDIIVGNQFQAKMNPLTPASSSPGEADRNKEPLEFTTGQVIKTINQWHPAPSSFAPHHDQEFSCESHLAQPELKQLPLFVETATRVAVAAALAVPDININNCSDYQPLNQRHHHREADSQGSFVIGAELDLELRLGHEPPKPTVALGTRKFF